MQNELHNKKTATEQIINIIKNTIWTIMINKEDIIFSFFMNIISFVILIITLYILNYFYSNSLVIQNLYQLMTQSYLIMFFIISWIFGIFLIRMKKHVH